MTRRGLLGLLAVVASLWGCGLSRPSEELRYRLSVEVDTPQGLKIGSSVIEVRGVKNQDWLTPEARGHRFSFRGEAVAVDLGGGRTLFALLKSESGLSDAGEYPWFAFGKRLAGTRDELQKMRMMRGWKGETVAMTGTETVRQNGTQQVPARPLLVRFRDITDPKSVERVDPSDLAKSFGAGVKLVRITLSVTDDPVTSGIERRLGWLGKYPEPRLDPTYKGSRNPKLSQKLTHGSFVQGAK